MSLPSVKEQVLEYNPTETLIFFRDAVTTKPKAILELKNKLDRQVAVKVKTTDPKKFHVKPSLAILPANGELQISITPQGHRSKDETTHKDRFQVISLPLEAPADEHPIGDEPNGYYEEIWGKQSKHPDQITYKFRCAMDKDLSSSTPSGLSESILTQAVHDAVDRTSIVSMSPEKGRSSAA